MKFLPHARLLLALSLALLGSSALALVPRLAPVRAQVRTAEAAPYLAADAQSVHSETAVVQERLQVRPSLSALQAHKIERAERRARIDRAPLHSRRILLPEFVIELDMPDDEDLADLRADRVRYFPEVAEQSLDEITRSPCLAPRDHLERPPRA